MCVRKNLVEDELFFHLLAITDHSVQRSYEIFEASLRYLTYYMGVPYAPMIKASYVLDASVPIPLS